MKKSSIIKVVLFFSLFISNINAKELAYLVSDINIPFWNIMAKGIKNKALKEGYDIKFYSANNLKKEELKNLSIALQSNIDGLIISPINSSTAVTILKLSQLAQVPVVISDIGTDNGEYVSFISSNNKKGAYEIGKVLTDKMSQLGWDKTGTVGIIAIPQTRANGKARTDGFMKAMNEANIKAAALLQQENFSYEETYDYSIELIKNNPNLKAIWLQGSNRYQAALDAIKNSNKTGDILLICFDSEPEFLEMIPSGSLLGSSMQQPYLMGQKSVEILDKHLKGNQVEKNIKLNILAISKDNIQSNYSIIKKNVLGIEK